MKQEIACPTCTDELHKLFPTATPFPGEHVKFVPGLALSDYMCDQCGAPIDQGKPCTAFSISSDHGAQPYYKWEHEYVSEVSA
jgi:hypothetical protein